MHTPTKNTDVSLSQEFKKHLSNELRKNGIIDYGQQKMLIKKIGQT